MNTAAFTDASLVSSAAPTAAVACIAAGASAGSTTRQGSRFSEARPCRWCDQTSVIASHFLVSPTPFSFL